MNLRRRRPEPPPPVQEDRFGGLRPHRLDPDYERPSREDRAPLVSQVFSPPVELPRSLKSKRER